jgi:putative mRNA 3-end processing factor
MKLISLGAGGEVGRSAFILSAEGKNILIDYGLKIHGAKHEENIFPLPFANFGVKPDLALISHSHLDHIGYLPSLFKNIELPWYCTPPALDIGEVLWNDTMKLAKIQNKRMPFTTAQIVKAKDHWRPALYHQHIHAPGVEFSFHDASHILGSAMIKMKTGGKTVLYTGDYKGSETEMHAPLKHPGEADIVISEGTYWKGDHPLRKDVERTLMDHIYETRDNGGTVLLPAFAIGRTQELATLIKRYDKDITVYIDGMGKDISRIYDKYPNYIKDYKAFSSAIEQCIVVSGKHDRDKAAAPGNVIVSTAGMMEGGPALGYLNQLPPNSKVILTGYQVEGSNGRYLLDDGRIKDSTGTGFLTVDIDVEFIDFSAHAGRSEIIDVIKKANPEKVVMVHSDFAKEFAQLLKDEHGLNADAIMTGEAKEL